LTNENSDAGHVKCSRGPQVPHPCSTFCTLAPSDVIAAKNTVLSEIFEDIHCFYVDDMQCCFLQCLHTDLKFCKLSGEKETFAVVKQT